VIDSIVFIGSRNQKNQTIYCVLCNIFNFNRVFIRAMPNSSLFVPFASRDYRATLCLLVLSAVMVQPALIAAPLGAAAAVVVATKAILGSRSTAAEVRRGVVDENEVSFACERVCASDRLMAKLGGLGKVRASRDTSRDSNA